MAKQYEFSLERVHFRTSLLKYEDVDGSVEVYLEESAVPDYDWIGAEPDFKVDGERLESILARLQDWAKTQGLVIKIWPESELGV